ncbi:response regulator [Paenibacillus macerans]|uniref:histidine kinase n=1 Tax=Paenibacillus macerans TaxID=44252 RepID=A0A091A7C2_PAEMA|nr:ATP-binding protein [Paenibacillus macerans]KFN12121.1 his Kinase A domain protein [Paenibacillus macerans]MCY7558372.1 ATP-binding protein [Paenibacillus macerans]MEC0150357.1 ATP-binding protein [Paenibacillus macerans]MUG23611.1 response regulator [Paenibacillus macerans]SUA84300.1 signal transduction histidine kinase [Paenibacillus macerans]
MHFNLRKQLKRKSLPYNLVLFALPFIVLILVRMAYSVYMDSERTVIRQQEEQLLTIAKLTSKNLEASFEEQIRNLEIVAGNRSVAAGLADSDTGPVQQAIEAYYKAKKERVNSIIVINRAGSIMNTYPRMNDAEAQKIYDLVNEDIKRAMKEKRPLIGDAKLEQPESYVLPIIHPVFLDNEYEGMLISSVDLNALYEQLVKPVKVGMKGYIHVKNARGIYLMNPKRDNIGKSVETLKRIYPNLDYKDLDRLIDMQMSREEGSAEYNSYWWMDKDFKKTKKFESFSRLRFNEFFWVVTAVMDYEEVKGPIAQSRIRLLEIFATILLILSCAFFIIMKTQRKKAALEVETKYLRKLNSTNEELRKKDMQLLHSQKLQELGMLTGGIAHNFNNLLTPIQGYSEIILHKLDPKDEIHEYVNEIYEASEKGRNIIEQILVFSRTDSGKGKHAAVSLEELIAETLNLVKPIISPNIKVIFEKKGGSSAILANKVQIQQVIMNLCNNACHAMKYNGGVLNVTLENVPAQELEQIQDEVTDTSGAYVKLSISDTGHGMSKDTMSRIFDPFFTTKVAGEGTGLGLFIVYGIIKNHNGFITVDSAEGKGSSFTVYLAQARSLIAGRQSDLPPVTVEPKSILLIDDDRKVLRAMRRGLESVGYKVFPEQDSIEALKIFEQAPTRFDVVITDQAMPYLKGLELAERMKALHPRIKIILVTGLVEENVTRYKERLIIDDYMCKPVTGSGLARVIGDIFRSS